MIARNADILVQVERAYIRIARTVFFVILDHVLVQTDRAGPGSQTEHRLFLSGHDFLHDLERFLADCVIVLHNNYFHVIIPPISLSFLIIAQPWKHGSVFSSFSKNTAYSSSIVYAQVKLFPPERIIVPSR